MSEAALPVPYFLARPEGAPPWPAVVVAMEGNGMSPQLLRVCERLAEAGYCTIAPDLYHRQGGSDPDRYMEQLQTFRIEDALDDLRACIAEVRALGASTVGITGFCMGGRMTYEAAINGLDVQAAAGFYGAGIPTVLGEPSCPLLLFFGAHDEWIPADDIEQVRKHHEGKVVVYADAGHGFMRDGSDDYVEGAATDAWSRLLAFFGEHLH